MTAPSEIRLDEQTEKAINAHGFYMREYARLLSSPSASLAESRANEAETNLRARIRELLASQREQDADCVPTNWLDSLLTGKDGIPIPADCPAIEKLLRAIKQRILTPTNTDEDTR